MNIRGERIILIIKDLDCVQKKKYYFLWILLEKSCERGSKKCSSFNIFIQYSLQKTLKLCSRIKKNMYGSTIFTSLLQKEKRNIAFFQ